MKRLIQRRSIFVKKILLSLIFLSIPFLLFLGYKITATSGYKSFHTLIFEKAIHAQSEKTNPVELGYVRWERNLDNAYRESAKTGKPVLLLFQEVPGCSGVKKFGREVLRHPLMVEAIENEFIPVFIYNNRSNGMDAKIRKQFQEPAWNYQVIRFLDHRGRDIIPRKERVWELPYLASRMVLALQKVKREVPLYLYSLSTGSPLIDHSQILVASYCFWEGEFALGEIPGVLFTEAGWYLGQEVTRVVYDKKKTQISDLVNTAQKLNGFRSVYSNNLSGKDISGIQIKPLSFNKYKAAKKSDQKRQLSGMKKIYNLAGISIMQLTKLNSLLPKDRSKALQWLSPNQRKAYLGQ